MTRQEARERLIKLAVMVAVEPPKHRSRFARCANVPWDLIDELRTTATAAGYDLESTFRNLDVIRAEQKAALRARIKANKA